MVLPIHGSDHCPGGPDPIPCLGAPISAVAHAYSRSQACNSTLTLEFDDFFRNDSSFGYTQVTSSRAKYITISTEGFYKYQAVIYWDTDWSASDFPYIEPTMWDGSSQNTLVNAADADHWDDTQSIIYGEQFTAAEMDHHSLAATVYFNFDTAYWGFATIGLGVNIRSSANRTKNFGGHIVVTRLGDLVSEVTIT